MSCGCVFMQRMELCYWWEHGKKKMRIHLLTQVTKPKLSSVVSPTNTTPQCFYKLKLVFRFAFVWLRESAVSFQDQSQN